MGFLEWSLTRGLVMPPTRQAIHATNTPFKLLQHVEGLTVEAVYLLKDFAPHLDDPAVARQFREVLQRFTRTRSTLILTGESIALPPAIEHKSVRYKLSLPSREELHATVEAVMHSLREGKRIRMELSSGETEKRFRKSISVAESMAPVVLWIDEIEKGMTPPTGNSSDGGVSQRIFGAFLTWLQEKKEQVFVVATANDLFSLPPELLRKGRFENRTRRSSTCQPSSKRAMALAAPK